jgi:membrane protein DedA with SNARE-associated domain
VPVWLVDLFARYGYGVVLVGVLVEGAGVPVPGETMLLAGAVFAHFGRLSLPRVIVAAVGGGIVGDNLGFLVGRLGGRALAERYGHAVGLTRARLSMFDRFFARHGAKTIFFARFITGLRVFCAVLAGGSGLPWRTFLPYNAAGVAVWSTTIGVVGYLLGESWERLERLVGRTAVVIVAAAIAVAAVAFLRWRASQGTSREDH